MNRRIRFNHGRARGVTEIFACLSHLVMRGSHGRILHGFLVCRVQLLSLICREICKTFPVMSFPTSTLSRLVLSVADGSELRRRKDHHRDQQFHFHVVNKNPPCPEKLRLGKAISAIHFCRIERSVKELEMLAFFRFVTGFRRFSASRESRLAIYSAHA